jgi:hypothetical protein
MPRKITKIKRPGPRTPQVRKPFFPGSTARRNVPEAAESKGRLDPCDNNNNICLLLTKIRPKGIGLIIAHFCVIY